MRGLVALSKAGCHLHEAERAVLEWGVMLDHGYILMNICGRS